MFPASNAMPGWEVFVLVHSTFQVFGGWLLIWFPNFRRKTYEYRGRALIGSTIIITASFPPLALMPLGIARHEGNLFAVGACVAVLENTSAAFFCTIFCGSELFSAELVKKPSCSRAIFMYIGAILSWGACVSAVAVAAVRSAAAGQLLAALGFSSMQLVCSFAESKHAKLFLSFACIVIWLELFTMVGFIVAGRQFDSTIVSQVIFTLSQVCSWGPALLVYKPLGIGFPGLTVVSLQLESNRLNSNAQEFQDHSNKLSSLMQSRSTARPQSLERTISHAIEDTTSSVNTGLNAPGTLFSDGKSFQTPVFLSNQRTHIEAAYQLENWGPPSAAPITALPELPQSQNHRSPKSQHSEGSYSSENGLLASHNLSKNSR